MPICYGVAIAYLAMMIAVFRSSQRGRRLVFHAGWTPAFLFAAVGTVLELSRGGVCPKGASGWPLCYLSLGLCTAVVVLYQRSSPPSQSLTTVRP